MWRQIPLFPAYEMYRKTRRIRLIEGIMQDVLRVGFDSEPGHLVYVLDHNGNKQWHLVLVSYLFAMTFPEDLGIGETPVAITNDWVSMTDLNLSQYEVNSVGQVRYVKYRGDDLLATNPRGEYQMYSDRGMWLTITRDVLLFRFFGKGERNGYTTS